MFSILFKPLSTRSFSTYVKQNRGTTSAYTKYINDMNGSMRDKIATVASFIPSGGLVADMGTGSGLGSYHLASLYPNLFVTGVDISQEMVRQAKENYKKSNLTFKVGDIAKRCLKEPQDAIINSSVLHHVTSFNGYEYQKAFDALSVQKEELKEHGVIIVRDFIAPSEKEVFLDLPENSEDIAFFLRFTQEFRKLHKNPGCAFKEISAPKGVRRFQLSYRLANEFILRKDYKEDWDLEIQEEYTYGSIQDLEKVFQKKLGLRVLSAIHLRNPWIIANRYKGQFSLRDLKGNEIDFPATNCILVGQKVGMREGITITKKKALLPKGYLQKSHFERTDTKDVFDLVKRPGRTIDIVPYFEKDKNLFVVTRMHYPRPILGCNEGNSSIDGSLATTYTTEPLNIQQGDVPFAEAIETALQKVKEITVKNSHPGIRIFPSPGGIEEEIVSRLVEIDPIQENIPITTGSGFSTSGTLSAIEAHHLLRASQVGALRDARLELNVYRLLNHFGIKLEPWIGEKITLQEGSPVTINDVKNIPPRRVFKRTEKSADFLELLNGHFVEKDASQKVVAKKNLEYVVPKNYSINTIAVAVLRKYKGEVLIGVDDDDRPAMQSFEGHSNLLVAPAWRLPKEINGIRKSKNWIANKLIEEYGLVSKQIWHLGSSYHPSAGVTPEIVFPLAIDASESNYTGLSKIKWVRLNQLLQERDLVLDGHLHILMLRAAHALSFN